MTWASLKFENLCSQQAHQWYPLQNTEESECSRSAWAEKKVEICNFIPVVQSPSSVNLDIGRTLWAQLMGVEITFSWQKKSALCKHSSSSQRRQDAFKIASVASPDISWDPVLSFGVILHI